MKSSWIHVLSLALLSAVLLALPADAAAQSDPASADDEEAAQQTEAAEGEADKKVDIGLFVEVGIGSNSIVDLDTTLRTEAGMVSLNRFDLEDMDHRRASVGWKLPGNKGRFRVVWTGMNEAGYTFSASGRDARASSGGAPVVDELDWWAIDVVDGVLNAERSAPLWTPAQDTNMDGNVQRDEVTYPAIQFSNTINIAPDMQNRVQHVDLLFGNTFGPRRVEGVWWGGMRYFAYEGTLLQGAWLQSQGNLGVGYTDGNLIRLIHARQETTAIGPTASLGLQVNFFEKRFQLFADGGFAFTLSDVEVDTGTFATLTPGNQLGTVLAGPSRLTQTRDRTSWHTNIQAGMRLTLKNGLSFEAVYYQGGFLDAVLTPTEVRIPQSAQELSNGASAIYATQDLRYDGWRSSIAFQF